MAIAQSPPTDEIVANQNRTPAGKLESGVLTLHLELRTGTWHIEADDGPPLFVQAFAETGRQSQIPGPLLRTPEGTTVHVTLTNTLKKKATVYGFNTHPGDPKSGIEVPPGESRDLSFIAGAPGTYFYWARTVSPPESDQPYLADAQLNGAFIIDPPGALAADRVFVINTMFVLADALHKTLEVLSINGKSYPYTEPLEYAEGETIRWRIVNPSFSEHPMHLHGSFYHVLSVSDFESGTSYAEPDRPLVVTQNLMPGHSMLMEWKPEHPGRWLFHCHFARHISSDDRIPVLVDPSSTSSDHPDPHAAHDHHDGMVAMNDMAGLVLMINVKSAPGSASTPAAEPARRKLDLVIEPTDQVGKSPTFACSVREGKKIAVSTDKTVGPPIVLTRGEPVEVTVLNHLSVPTVIHWHGLELDSYYDGVIGGGLDNQVTPAIAPGASFVARFTPNRAGTFIYHTHAPDHEQLAGGIYGALIVLDPGEQFDPEHDKLLILGAREFSFLTKRLTLNGLEQPNPIVLEHGSKYRLRVINMGPDLAADVQLGTPESPVTWRAIAKDGAALPAQLAKSGNATLHIASGETYDFEFQPQSPGEILLQMKNEFNDGKVVTKFVVQ